MTGDSPSAPVPDPVVALADEVGELWSERGGTRMSGRVFGYLLFADSSSTSARDLQRALSASAGAISGAARYLVAVGLVRPVPGPQRRQQYYAVSADPFVVDLTRTRDQLGRWRTIAARASDSLGPAHQGAERARLVITYVQRLDSGLAHVIADLLSERRADT